MLAQVATVLASGVRGLLAYRPFGKDFFEPEKRTGFVRRATLAMTVLILYVAGNAAEGEP